MKDILIDNSYLNSAFRCIKGKATSENDLLNFFRFLGEILSHKRIFISVNPTGPVYQYTSECLEFLKRESKGNFEIETLLQSNIDYQSIIDKLSKYILDNKFDILISAKFSEDVQPQFSSSSPDILFHEWLISKDGIIPNQVNLDSGATYTPFFLAERIDLYNNFRQMKIKNWTLEKSLALAAKLRSLIYTEIGNSNDLIYIPSVTRALNSQYTLKTPSLRSLLINDEVNYNDFKRNFLDNKNILSAIISRNGCMPSMVLSDAFTIRDKTNPLRNQLYKKPFFKKGDSLLLYQYGELEELKNILNKYLQEGKGNFSYDDFTPSFTYDSIENEFGVSFPIIGTIAKALGISREMKLLKKLEPFILPVVQTRFENKSQLLYHLRKHSGLYA